MNIRLKVDMLNVFIVHLPLMVLLF